MSAYTQTKTLVLLSLLLLLVGVPSITVFKDVKIVSDIEYTQLPFTEQIKVCTQGNYTVGFYGGAAFTTVGLFCLLTALYTFFTYKKEIKK